MSRCSAPTPLAAALLISSCAAAAQAVPVSSADTALSAEAAEAPESAENVDAVAGAVRSGGRTALDRVTISAARKKLEGASTRLPLTARETPQSMSSLDAGRLENETLISINDVMQHITGVTVSFYDTQHPLYFARGFQITDFQIDGAHEQAQFIRTKWDLGLKGGVVVSNPVPQEAAMPKEEIDRITEQALAEAEQQGITGKAVTSFLLDRIKQLTGGRSLSTNIALVKHNALVGARLAVALHSAHA